MFHEQRRLFRRFQDGFERAAKVKVRAFLQNVGKHHDKQVGAFAKRLLLEGFLDLLGGAGDVLDAGNHGLRDQNVAAFDGEGFDVFFQKAAGAFLGAVGRHEIHVVSQIVGFDGGDLGESLGQLDVFGGGGRGLEVHRVRDDGAQHEAGQRFWRLDAVFEKHAGDNGRGAADDFVAEINRPGRGEVVDAVMIHDLENRRLFDVGHGLGKLVVIHEDHRLVFVVDSGVFEQVADQPVLVVDDRIGAEAVFAHFFGGVFHELVDVKHVHAAGHEFLDRGREKQITGSVHRAVT